MKANYRKEMLNRKRMQKKPQKTPQEGNFQIQSKKKKNFHCHYFPTVYILVNVKYTRDFIF